MNEMSPLPHLTIEEAEKLEVGAGAAMVTHRGQELMVSHEHDGWCAWTLGSETSPVDDGWPTLNEALDNPIDRSL